MRLKTVLWAGLSALVLSACGDANMNAADQAADAAAAQAQTQTHAAVLDAVLQARAAETQARYVYRHPQETLLFFGVEPGMRVAEVLPGGGWYTKLLLPYLGREGGLVGVDYALAMWPEFGGFADEEFLENKKTWPVTWTESANAWRSEGDAEVQAFAFGHRDTSLDGTLDMVLFIRALHNLARFEADGAYLSEALADSYALLKPGGIVGVVQHQAREDMPNEWADGRNGYLKKSDLIAVFEAAGFELVGESDVNENPADIPTAEDGVWRLPPTLGTSRENPDLRAELEAVGESHRMTLKFKKI